MQSEEVSETGYVDGTYQICSVENNVWRAGPANPSIGLGASVPFKKPFHVSAGDVILLQYEGQAITGVSVFFSIGGNNMTGYTRPTNGYSKEYTAVSDFEAEKLFMRFQGNTTRTFVFTPHIYLNGVRKA